MIETTELRPSFREALRFWVRLGFISFGGPAGQIAILHKEVVERRKWMDEGRFTSGLAFCTFLPGPEAQQLATYIGWSLHGTIGGLAAGILFFLPAAAILLVLSFIRAEFGSVPFVSAILYGLRPVVVAVIFDAVLRMAGKRIATRGAVVVAVLAFVAAFLLRTPFPWIVVGAAIAGLALSSFRPTLARDSTPGARLSLKTEAVRISAVLATGLSLWAVPWAILMSFGDAVPLFQKQYLFFTQAALVTFGGAYAVLGYVTQAAVEQFHWLSRAEVIDGLALAETTPGPLIIVLQYVGFLAGWNDPQGLSRGLSGTIGAFVTTYATFLPSLVLVFLGAPYVDRMTSLPRLASALGAIGAAVTGVIVSLGLDYGISVVLPADRTASPDLFALLTLIAAFVALRKGQGFGLVLFAGGTAGSLYQFLQR